MAMRYQYGIFLMMLNIIVLCPEHNFTWPQLARPLFHVLLTLRNTEFLLTFRRGVVPFFKRLWRNCLRTFLNRRHKTLRYASQTHITTLAVAGVMAPKV